MFLGTVRRLRTLTLGLSYLGLSLPAARASTTVSEEARAVLERIEEFGLTFEEHPELVDRRGSGWKPYQRSKWFHEQRLDRGELPPADARWRAWERKRELERTSGAAPRSIWFALGPTNLAGRMLSLAFDPTDASTLYAGAAGGGVWKSTNSGTSWEPISDEIPSLAVGGIAVSALDPQVVVIGTGEPTLNVDRIGGVGILRSTDAGSIWQTTSLSLGASSGHGFHFVEAGPTGTFLAGASDGLYRSSDHGATWDLVKVGGDYYDAKWKPGDPLRVYTVKGNAASGNNVKVSSDDGVTWSKAGVGQPFSFQIGKSKLAVSADRPSWVYALYGTAGTAGDYTGLYRSTDDGATWSAQNTAPDLFTGQSWYNLCLAADPNDATTLIGGGVPLRRSTNGGASWISVGGVHVDQHAIAYEPGSSTNVWVGNDGGMYRSVNDGATWQYRSSGLATYQFYDICVNNGPDPYYVLGGTQDNGTDKWAGTTSWAEGLGGDGMVCNVDATNGTTVFAERQFGDHRRNLSSGSGSWSNINFGLPPNNGQWVVPVALDPSDGSHLYTHHSAFGIYRSTDAGSSWTNVAAHNAVWIDISPLDGDVVWTVSGGGARVTTDDGSTWHSAADYGFLTGTETKVLAHPTEVNTAFVTFSSYGEGLAHIAMTTDLGWSWTDVTGDFPSQPVNAIAINPSHPYQWFLGTDVGVWASATGGEHWGPFEFGLPNAVVVDLEVKDSLQKLVAGTHGRGAWEVNITPPLSTAAPETGPLARNLMLDPPWPNPLSDRALLRHAARHPGVVTLRIFDVRGRLVADLAEFPSGDGVIRTTPWFPDGAPAGVYFAVLQAGDARRTQKLVVAK